MRFVQRSRRARRDGRLRLVDGWRMVAYKDGRRPVKLISRQGKNLTHRFPALVAAIRTLEGSLVLDGEVAIYDRQLISRFESLRHHAPPDLATPPLFMVFDCLGQDRRF